MLDAASPPHGSGGAFPRDLAPTRGASGHPAPGHLVEARLDLLNEPPCAEDLARLAVAAPGRLLATCRPGAWGARSRRDERHVILRSALQQGAVAVDLEADGERLPNLPARLVIVSHHEAPESRELSAPAVNELAASLVAAAEALAAATSAEMLLKLALPTRSAVTALDLALAGKSVPERFGWAPVGLGAGGSWLRILAAAARPVGSPGPDRSWCSLAYCAAERPLPGADLGQPLLASMLGAFRSSAHGPTTRVFGIVGWPLEHTWSPELHSTLFARRGLDAVLVPLPVRDVREMTRMIDALGLEGLAVTMPHKRAARVIAQTEPKRVLAAGVLNTLRRREGRWEADSFDGLAVTELVARHVELAGARIVIFGAGGAARAAAAELAASGAHVTLTARRMEQAEEAAHGVSEAVPVAAHGSIQATPLANLPSITADVVIQATPMGSDGAPHSSETPRILDALAGLSAAVALDMVSTPPDTAFLRRQRAAGRVTIDGLTMLALQAAAQQRWWVDDASAPAAEEVERVLREISARHV